MSRPAIYYGWTPTGKRIHLGDVAVREDKGITILDSFCGAIMKAWEDGSMPPSGRVTEFCRNCFRTLAWEVFERSILHDSKSKRKEKVAA